MTTTTKSLHPLVLAAAVAVLLFCGVGTAALMGWLPSSQRDAQPLAASTSAEQLASLQANQPQANLQPAGAQALAALPPPPQPVRQPQPQQQPQQQYAAAPAPQVCGNCGVIEAIHEVNTRAEGSGVGAAGGAVVGGLLGNQVGGGHGNWFWSRNPVPLRAEVAQRYSAPAGLGDALPAPAATTDAGVVTGAHGRHSAVPTSAATPSATTGRTHARRRRDGDRNARMR